ncbi:NAD-dependent epimerase/dehydratase family protein [Pseudovibrio exalbescens]|uniref:NAD-dependent epimerase/dehydratase family protein n=1 Tax=Pseudovibrio exalbescens TaxID=197461 RepID=UPI0023661ACB|nr:NAD-dependent epimerase/dehydratase family protein [Pseudovibrio exalbescens]MDD7911062.1 NAD-dependent epimerase/dehydratase family protein [Pseudovibrio exalbescens]
MFKVDTSAPILVTGASGYVAGWIVKSLLEAGATVHACVRDPGNQTKLQHLSNLAERTNGKLKFFASDLLEKGSYAAAMKGCKFVFHTASPFTISVQDPQQELIDPALKGTTNVLEQANNTPSVQRVVLTSSCAAIFGDNADIENTPGGVFTEEVWNTSSSLSHNPYSYSKRLAEQKAWAIAKAQDRWDLVVINPSLVIGPGLNPNATSESFSLIRQFGNGTLRHGAPKWGMGVVDVRDLAEAHLAAAFTPEAHGRNIINGHNTDFFEMSKILHRTYGDSFPIPKTAAPKWLIWLAGPVVNTSMTRKMIARNVDVPFKADNTKAVKELGVTYRPLRQSLEEMFQQQIDAGAFAKS